MGSSPLPRQRLPTLQSRVIAEDTFFILQSVQDTFCIQFNGQALACWPFVAHLLPTHLSASVRLVRPVVPRAQVPPVVRLLRSRRESERLVRSGGHDERYRVQLFLSWEIPIQWLI